jgi:hypothetical protein
MKVIALAAVDDEIDAHILPGLGFTRVPEFLGSCEKFELFFAHYGTSFNVAMVAQPGPDRLT